MKVSSCSNTRTHEVESVSKSGEITIRRIVPEIQLTEPKAWNIIIELDKSFTPASFNVVWK